jgi:hypothetical protein
MSMQEPFETYEHAGLTVELYPDYDAPNPRTEYDRADRAGTIIELGSGRDSGWGDSTDPRDPDELMTDCPTCSGTGATDRYTLWRVKPYGHERVGAGTLAAMEVCAEREPFALYVEQTDCPACEGRGEVPGSIAEYAAAELDAAIAIPVQYQDYGSSGCRLLAYGPGEGEEGANGVYIIDRPTAAKEWGTADDPTGAVGALAYGLGELAEYDSYLQGEVSGYVITDADGDDLSLPGLDVSCWGFIGSLDYVRGEANAAAESCRAALDAETLERAACAARDIATV